MHHQLKVRDHQLINKVKDVLLDGGINEPNRFILLINDYSYNFNTGLSSRFLNYYEEKDKKFIRSYRNTEKGKRWFSLVAKVTTDFFLYLKDNGYNDEEIKEGLDLLSERIDANNEASFIDFAVIASATLVGFYDVFFNIEKDKSGSSTITLLPDENVKYFNVSASIRNTLFEPNGRLKPDNKDGKFPVRLITEIDKIRAKINIPLIVPRSELSMAVMEPEVEYSNGWIYPRDLAKLNDLPREKINKKYDIVYQTENGGVYGIEIKYIGNNDYLQLPKMNMKANSIEQLASGIAFEIAHSERQLERQK